MPAAETAPQQVGKNVAPTEQEEPLETEWEPDEDLLEYLRSLGIPEQDFKGEALRLARLSEEDRSYERELMRSANRLASLVEGLNEDFKVQTIMSEVPIRDVIEVVEDCLKERLEKAGYIPMTAMGW